MSDCDGVGHQPNFGFMLVEHFMDRDEAGPDDAPMNVLERHGQVEKCAEAVMQDRSDSLYGRLLGACWVKAVFHGAPLR